MRSFSINEISAVDRPAQAGALKVLMKRDSSMDDQSLFEAMFGKGEKKTEGGKEFSSSDYAYVPDESKPSTWKLRLTGTPGGEPDSGHIGAAAAALGPGFRGHKVEIPSGDRERVVSRVRSAWRKLNPDKSEDEMPEGIKKSNHKEETMTKEEIDALNKKHADEMKKVQADLAKAKKLSDLKDEEKKKYNSLSDDDKDDFLNKTKEQRAEMMKRDGDTDPVVYKSLDGTEYRKSDGALVTKLAKQADENAKALKAEREKREDTELKKRASEYLKNMPGDESVKAALLKSVEGIADEEIRKKALEALKAGDNSLSGAFVRKGHNGAMPEVEDKEGALSELDKMAKAHATDHKTTYAKAYDEVIRTEVGKELYAKTLVS